ncbi:hypothetical protein HPP92_021404 [Vanilla planifolia]|uniref:Uncharacterized protein n=1 Tax=Vanilla planifolia TaxID=51239 RepID=A0A835UGS5_VANPL|nr:hypothetical protein HPP92_021404 [Vanilla planifolia]
MGGKSSSQSRRRSIGRSSLSDRNFSQSDTWGRQYPNERSYYQNYPLPSSQSHGNAADTYSSNQSFSTPYAYSPESFYPRPLPSQPHSSSASSGAGHQLPKLDRRYSR